MEQSKHSPIGASSRSRWSKCPGSVKLSENLPNVAGPAAIEGTLAHELVAQFLNQAFSEDKDVNSIVCEYVEHLSHYLNYLKNLKDQCSVLLIEHHFNMDSVFKGGYGTADCVAYNEKTKTLHVVDYKHGKNLVVEVTNNLQLEYYALGALKTLDFACKWVQMTIIQPRANHPAGPIRHWRVPTVHFIDVEMDLISEVKKTKEKKALLLAGSHCIFCAAKFICPQKQDRSAKKAKSEFRFYSDPKNDFKVVG